MTYNNPILPGFYPDPTICRQGEDYYLAASSFEYFPGVPLFHSKDLVNWRQIGHVLTRESQLSLADLHGPHGVFAPTLRYHAGRFYLIVTDVRGRGHFFVYADDPHGEWSDPVAIEGDGFDPDLFFDDDGKVYVSYHPESGGIRLYELDLSSGLRIGEETTIWSGYEDKLCEAPHMYKINGMYYLLVAEGETHHGHMVVAARSESPKGPFVGCPRNPILTHRSLGWSPIGSIGHGDLVEAQDGSWWIVFLGVRRIGWGNQHLGRETFLAPVEWDADGWPVVHGGRPIELEMQGNGLPLKPWPPSLERDHFEADVLSLCWNFRRNPRSDLYSLRSRPGWLELRGERSSLHDTEHHSFIGRRQQHFACEVSTLIHYNPQEEGTEAGLTVYMSHEFHYALYLTRKEGRLLVAVRKKVADIELVVSEYQILEQPVILQIIAEKEKYRFGFRLNEDSEFHELAAGQTRLLSQEVSGGFSGVYIAIYAAGNGKLEPSPAYYDWFDYKPSEFLGRR
jgi:alpha-N-arabinofuranosidase